MSIKDVSFMSIHSHSLYEAKGEYESVSLSALCAVDGQSWATRQVILRDLIFPGVGQVHLVKHFGHHPFRDIKSKNPWEFVGL